jgi:hypothetical protein
MEVVALVEDLAVDVAVMFFEEPDLAVLLGDEFLVHRGDLDEQVFVGNVEVGGEERDGRTVGVEFDGEGRRLVLPGEAVEIEESCELPLAVVSEADVVSRSREVDGQVTPPCEPV